MKIRLKKPETTNEELRQLYMTNEEYKEVPELPVEGKAEMDRALDTYFWGKRPLIFEFYDETEKLGVAASQLRIAQKNDKEVHKEWVRKSMVGSEEERAIYKALLNDQNMVNERFNRGKRMHMGLNCEYQTRNAFIEELEDVIILRNPTVDFKEGIDQFVISIKTGKIYNVHVTSNSKRGTAYANYKGTIKNRKIEKGDVWITYNPHRDSRESHLIDRFPFIRPEYVKSEFERWESDDSIGEKLTDSYLLHFLQEKSIWSTWDLSVCNNISEKREKQYAKTLGFFLHKIFLKHENKKLIELKDPKRPAA